MPAQRLCLFDFIRACFGHPLATFLFASCMSSRDHLANCAMATSSIRTTITFSSAVFDLQTVDYRLLPCKAREDCGCSILAETPCRPHTFHAKILTIFVPLAAVGGSESSSLFKAVTSEPFPMNLNSKRLGYTRR